MDARHAATATAAVPVTMGVVAVLLPFLILGAAGGATPPPTGQLLCGGGGTGQTVAGVPLDAEQLGNAVTITQVTADRQLPAYAAVVALDTAYTESSLHNYQSPTDHDSEGLFQQRISIYTKQVADDPVKATGAFLGRLVKIPNWQTSPAGVDAQAVQRSGYPARYPPNVPLAQALAGLLWPTAAAAAPADATASTGAPPVPVCAGGGGAGKIVGPTGNNIAGTTTIPAGLVINGSPKGKAAVRFALAQLGKPYVFGAAGPDAYDCSGLTMAAWAAAGIALPHLAAAQAGLGTAEPVDFSEAEAGDLVLIPGSDGTWQAPGHVGMIAGYVDEHDGRHLWLVQAPERRVPVELTQATDWAGQVITIRHIA